MPASHCGVRPTSRPPRIRFLPRCRRWPRSWTAPGSSFTSPRRLRPPTATAPTIHGLPSFYFKELARGFRPELGSPTIPSVESMRRMMPHNKLWPVNEMWAQHDWWLGSGWDNGAASAAGPRSAIADFGAPKGIEDFCRKAQFVNMQVFKGIYEAWNDRMWNDCTGVMIWMSNPAWPSLTWNTYDYYMEPTAAYFACRRGVRTDPHPVERRHRRGEGDQLHVEGFEGARAPRLSSTTSTAASSRPECIRLIAPPTARTIAWRCLRPAKARPKNYRKCTSSSSTPQRQRGSRLVDQLLLARQDRGQVPGH